MASQQRYTSSDFANIVNIMKIDVATITIGGMTFELFPMSPRNLEIITNGGTSSTGQSSSYAWFDQAIALYPIPSEASWTVRLLCVEKTAAPATDGEASNSWMVDAGRMVRCRAKGHLYAHVIKDQEKAGLQYQLADEAHQRLTDKTIQMTKTGDYIVEAWDPY